ncbi:uncharacterized protein F5891DRAFT_977413 [Suillus fuscotomentosus]|uniref:Uncharacterized protein n=1 Tax=Suillus fuscotomentosus TaxID=1912939 RepID=A0AAD4HPC0_9AGAM|nr:uncharacterized protein F5891DRAFT_977413 [Suillus fuscotomentosus]KAG1903867.1 hypothetical protein F5891DRAFT_977413 [Suillus fuscotomentosus]
MAKIWQKLWDFFIVLQIQCSNPPHSSMYSHKKPVDKARRLQDEHIKANLNFFLTWDQWVPPNLCPTPSSPKDRITMRNNKLHVGPNLPTISGPVQVAKSTVATMPSDKTQNTHHPKNNGGHTVFDMYWNTEGDGAPTVKLPTAPQSADLQVAGLEQTPPRVHLAPDLELATMETLMVDGSIPFSVGQYNMGWTDSPCALVVGFAANFDMCWGDVLPGRDIHLDSASPIAPPIDLVESAPTNGLPNQIVDTGKELLCQATMRLDSIDAVIRDDRGQNSVNMSDANWLLISDYQHACDQFLTASKDVAKIQHLMNMHRKIDDPLHILLLAMRKMGQGHSPIQ